MVRQLAAAMNALADAAEKDPTGKTIEDALAAALDHFAGALAGADTTTAAVPAPPEPTVEAAAPPPVVEVPSPAGEPSQVATQHKCPECGSYFTGPAVCANEHPPAATVDLGEVPTVDEQKPAPAAPAEESAPPAGPEWPAGA